MQRLKNCATFVTFIIIIAGVVAKSRLIFCGFPFAFPLTISSYLAFLVSLFMAEEYRMPNNFMIMIVFLAILYALSVWYSNYLANVFLISLCAPSKIIFTCIFVKIFLKLKLTRIQIIGLSFITLGIIVPLLKYNETNLSTITFKGVCACIISSLIFSMLNISYEIYTLNDKSKVFWNFVLTSSLVGLFISTFAFFSKYILKK